MNNQRYNRLLSPFQLKDLKLKNRIVKSPQAMLYVEADGFINERQKDFYEALAKGGVGMIITGALSVDDVPTGLNMPGIWDDKFIPGLTEWVNVMHKHNCPVVAQLWHVGPAAIPSITGIQGVSASALSPKEMPFPYYPTPRGCSLDEIKMFIEEFITAAERALKAGFDGVEVHGANSYFLASFLSRAWNKRQDMYGCQDMKNRTRIMVEIMQGIRERLGQDYLMGVRINGKEWGTDKGITPEESQEIAKIMEKADADYISVTGFGYGRHYWRFLPEHILYPEPIEETKGLRKRIKREGLHAAYTAPIKKLVSVPIIGGGRLAPEMAERLLQRGAVDLTLFGRRLFADPELPNKISSGRLEDIVPCTACVTCETPRIGARRCRINAALGREREFAIKPAARKKRVMVVGGGPGGMEAARVARLRGHDVSLYEKEPRLGGLLHLAAMIKGSDIEDIPAINRYLKTQITKLGVKINLRTEVTPRLIEELTPDVVIVATGPKLTVPEIPGIERPNVLSAEELHRRSRMFLNLVGPQVLRWLTKFYLPVGRRILVIGGQLYGCETAEFMVKRGREVIIVEDTDQFGKGITDRNLDLIMPWFEEKNVRILTEVKYEEITDRGLTITKKDGTKETIDSDTILVTVPPVEQMELFNALDGMVSELYTIGSCKGAESCLIVDAIHDGSHVGRVV